MKAMFLIFGASVCVGASLVAAQSITVEAGDFDRRETVVTFKMPFAVNLYVESAGKTAPLQFDHEGNAWFILEELKRGQRKTFDIHFTAQMGAGGGVRAVCADDDFVSRHGNERTNCTGPVKLMLARPTGPNGRATIATALTYQTEKTQFPPGRDDLKEIFHRGGYIHPVLSPSGKQITDDYPLNHKHHHGIWWAWTHTEFEGRKPDFWNMGDGKGTVEFVALDKTWSGPVHAGFTSRLRQVDLTGPQLKTALNETWNVKLYAIGNDAKHPCFVFDVEVTDICATDSPLKLPQYRYGGIGVRGNWAWNGKDNLNFLNSEGVTDRSKGDNNETAGRWAHLGGLVDGTLTGLAILDHPDNAHAPQPQRIHPTEPFFCFAPQQSGGLEIAPSKPFVARYRFVVADGAPDKAELNHLWNDYAHPPKVTVGQAK